MNTQMRELDRQVDSFRQWILKALEIGERLSSLEGDALQSALDERQRVLDRTTSTLAQIRLLQDQFATDLTLKPADKAILREKRSLVSDLAPKLLEQEKRLLKSMRTKAQSIQTELALNTRSTQVIRQYLGVPNYK